MSKCPSCGSELPSPSHFGMKANPKNYVAPQIPLRSGRKYHRTFAVLFYPSRHDDEHGELSPCVVVASEEYSKDGRGLPFVAGSKFYDDEVDKLQMAWETVFAAEVAFRAFLRERSAGMLMQARINQLYNYMNKRTQLAMMADSILSKMRLCHEITRQEEKSEGG